MGGFYTPPVLLPRGTKTGTASVIFLVLTWFWGLKEGQRAMQVPWTSPLQDVDNIRKRELITVEYFLNWWHLMMKLKSKSYIIASTVGHVMLILCEETRLAFSSLSLSSGIHASVKLNDKLSFYLLKYRVKPPHWDRQRNHENHHPLPLSFPSSANLSLPIHLLLVLFPWHADLQIFYLSISMFLFIKL